MSIRQLVLDTETTGMQIEQGNRVIEIGCVEVLDRHLTQSQYHQYINPQRDSEPRALEVHGLTTEFLSDKPLFADIVDEFLDYVRGAQLIIHNAPFDVGFIDHELSLLDRGLGRLADYCTITDSLAFARRKHPAQRNSLDALCSRYDVDNTHRTRHGALLDAEILAEVYLRMTGGQVSLGLGAETAGDGGRAGSRRRKLPDGLVRPPVVQPTAEELAVHEAMLADLGESCLWNH